VPLVVQVHLLVLLVQLVVTQRVQNFVLVQTLEPVEFHPLVHQRLVLWLHVLKSVLSVLLVSMF
jgi:hypothetical protein